MLTAIAFTDRIFIIIFFRYYYTNVSVSRFNQNVIVCVQVTFDIFMSLLWHTSKIKKYLLKQIPDNGTDMQT